MINWCLVVILEFRDSLSLWIKNSGFTRKELIALLQNEYYEEFKGLDSITLSRWLNGKSTPPLYKQFYVAKCLNVNFREYVNSLDLSKIKYPTKYDTVLYNLTKALDFSISALSYRYVPKYVKSEISNDSYQEFRHKFGEFYDNVSSLTKFQHCLYEKGNDLDYKSIVLKNEDNEIIGHWSGIVDIMKLNGNPSFISIPPNEASKSCVVFLGYYVNSEHYFELITQAVCLYLFSYWKKKDYVYFFNVNYRPIIEFCKLIFNAEEIRYYPPLDEKEKMGVYLLKFDIVKSISNPVVLSMVKKKLNCLSTCNYEHCKLCNLQEIEKIG